jgi:hypothetical protein
MLRRKNVDSILDAYKGGVKGRKEKGRKKNITSYLARHLDYGKRKKRVTKQVRSHNAGLVAMYASWHDNPPITIYNLQP